MSVLLDQVGQLQAQEGHRPDLSRKKIVHVLTASAIVLAGALIVSLIGNPSGKDFISYWAAAKMLLHHSDPYSIVNVMALEKVSGFSGIRPIMMRNPPWALFLVAPLGLGNATTGLFLWTLVAAGCVVAFIRLLNVPLEDRVFAFLFMPVVDSFRMAQSSPFLLLGFSLFLFHYRRRPFLAGASLLFMAIKPHLFLVFWAVLLMDCIYKRRFIVFAGLASALTAGSAFAMYFDRRIWQHYFAMLRGSELDQEFFPTISAMFRLLIDVRATWLLFVPSVVAIVWALWYFIRNRSIWDWRVHGLPLMLVTVLVSPYGWVSDEIVLLPAIAFAVTVSQRRRYSLEILVAINMLALLILMVVAPRVNSGAYLWTPLAWLTWFLYSTKGSPKAAGLMRGKLAL